MIMGCVSQTGEQGLNIARNAALAAGFPEEVVGTTIDRQCGSSQQAAHFAAQGVMAGAYDVVIAAGIESMTRIPMGITAQQGPGMPFGPLMLERYSHGLVPQGLSAEMICEKWGLSRTQLDQISLDSHQRAGQGHRGRSLRLPDRSGHRQRRVREPKRFARTKGFAGRRRWRSWQLSSRPSRSTDSSPPATRRRSRTGPPRF